jgi:LuxR family maltose regulon positive regulatory protein
MLAGWRGLRLIGLIAPTGYGKSTFAAWWLQQLTPDDPPVSVVLSLDPDAAAFDVTLQRLAAGLRSFLPSLDDLRERHAAGQLTTRQLARAIVGEIERTGRHVVIVVDDFQFVDNPGVIDLIQEVLDRGSSFLHLVLLSRTRPTLHFGRLILDDAAVLLDERHLRFDHDEFTAFVDASPLAALSPQQRAVVEERCDGWIAALQLLALSLPREPIDALLGPRSGHLLLEHLEYEVFRFLPADLQRFLVEIGPLPFLTAELVAAATDRTVLETESLLQRALDANVFLTPIESLPTTGATRFRFHPLFRELLRHKLLSKTDPAAVDAMRRRAADWLAQHDEVDAALSLLPPDDMDAAARLVGGRLRPTLLRGNLLAARRWLARIPAPRRLAHPSLAVDAAWLALLGNDRDLAARIAEARTALASCADPERTAEVDVLQAFAFYLNNQRDAAYSTAAAIRLPEASADLAAGYLNMLQALLHDRPEQIDVRRRTLHRAGEIFRAIGFADAAIDAELGACVLERRDGRSLAAVAAYEHAFAVIRHFDRERSGIAVDAHVQFGEVLYLMDRIAEAHAQFERAVAVADRFAPDCIDGYRARVEMQLCALADGTASLEFDEADDARRWAATIADHPPLLVATTAWPRMLRDIRLGRIDHARHSTEVFGLRWNQLSPDTHEYLRLLVLAGAVLADEPVESLAEALRTFRDEMRSSRNAVVAARAGSLLAFHFIRCGDEPAARVESHALRKEAKHLRMPRLVTDFPTAPALLQGRPDRHSLRRFGLSRQEARVLDVLVEDLTNKEIAVRLSLSTATVSTHLKNVFRKLGVHSREEAVQVVRGAE